MTLSSGACWRTRPTTYTPYDKRMRWNQERDRRTSGRVPRSGDPAVSGHRYLDQAMTDVAMSEGCSAATWP